jgi:hypothetical protein
MVWYSAISDNIIILDGTSVLSHILGVAARGGWCFTGGFPFKLHMEFLYRGFHGGNIRVAVYTGAMHRGLTVLLNRLQHSGNLYVPPALTFNNCIFPTECIYGFRMILE